MSRKPDYYPSIHYLPQEHEGKDPLTRARDSAIPTWSHLKQLLEKERFITKGLRTKSYFCVQNNGEEDCRFLLGSSCWKKLAAEEIVRTLQEFPKDCRVKKVWVLYTSELVGTAFLEYFWMDRKGRFWKDRDLPEDPIKREILMVKLEALEAQERL